MLDLAEPDHHDRSSAHCCRFAGAAAGGAAGHAEDCTGRFGESGADCDATAGHQGEWIADESGEGEGDADGDVYWNVDLDHEGSYCVPALSKPPFLLV